MKPTEVFKLATFTVKNIPDELYARLKSVAEINRRSINSEIIMCIEHAVVSRQIDPETILENARQLRLSTIRSGTKNSTMPKQKAGCDRL